MSDAKDDTIGTRGSMRDSEYARQGIEYGLTSPAELDDMAEAFRAWAADDDALFVVVHGEVLARA